MPLKVPNALEIEVLTSLLTSALTLKLYSNNVTPADSDTAATYTEVSGGGYASKPLTFANWTITGGAPTVALYGTTQVWTFTGPLNPPNTCYGYFVTRNSDGKLMWAERFAASVVPFSPVNGSIIRILPRFTAESQF